MQGMTLFRLLIDLLFPPRDQESIVRDATPESLGAEAAPRTHHLSGASAATLLPYQGRITRASILEAKFAGSTRAASLLGSVLADFLEERLGEEGEPARESLILVPVPLSPQRLRERGYNQAERIAAAALRNLGDETPLLDAKLLARTRDTRPQTSLARSERKKNLAGAFACTRPLDPSPTYIVFDDVLTTGSTLAGACKALREAGAVRVEALALAH